MEKEEVVFKNEKFTWYSYCLVTIGILVAGLVLNSVKILFFLPLFLYFCILEYKHLDRRLILNRDGFTDENGSFYAWKSIDHCYIKPGYSRSLVIVLKDKDEPKISVSLGNYFFKNRELEDAVNRLAGKSLIQYTHEDKKVEKEEDKAAIRLLLKFFLIVIGVLLLIALFSIYYARIDNKHNRYSLQLFLFCNVFCIIFALQIDNNKKNDIHHNQSRRTAEEELRLYVRPVRTQQQRGAQPVYEGGRAGTSYSF